jgi:RHS repeat-associated protein
VILIELQSVSSDSISLKYDPAGNRVQKSTSAQGTRKYIVDIVGDLPVILLELEATGYTDYTVKKAYIYANSQILAEYEPQSSQSPQRYFYLHDRLGSVRQLINSSGSVVKLYTYSPFGETIEEQGSIDNDFKFTGQYFDRETGQYYLRARQYSPYLARFTGRDLIIGSFDDPMSLHKYLYCKNDPINRIDPAGLWDANTHHQIIDAFISDENLRKDMYKGSDWVDSILSGNQSANNAYRHAMHAPNQSIEEAQQKEWEFMEENYFHYKECLKTGNIDEAYYSLGVTMHPVMDSTCYVHNWLPWTPVDAWSHHREEPKSINERTLNKTVKLMQDTMRDLDAVYEWAKCAELAGW